MADLNLLPAYLVNGEDQLKRETVMKRMRSRLEKLGDLDFNCDIFDGKEAQASDITAACNTMPFGIEKRLVIVNNADAMKKADAEVLVEYLKSPADFTVLMLIANKLAKNTRLYKAASALGAKAVIDCAPRKAYELPAQVRAMAPAHGIAMTDAAAKLLVELVGEDTVHLDAELKKIALAHTGTQPVGPEEVSRLVTRTSQAKPWDFSGAFSQRNVVECVSVRKKLGDTSAYALIGFCVGSLREMLVCHALAARGQSGAGPLAKQLKMPDWKAKKVAASARLWTADELRRALSSARDCERAMKSGSDAEGVFFDWAISTCAGKRS